MAVHQLSDPRFIREDPGERVRVAARIALIALSAGVAVISSMIAFDLMLRAGRPDSSGRRLTWLRLAALVFGSGMWTVHFTILLAVTAGHYVYYRAVDTLLPLFVAIACSRGAFAVLKWTGRRMRLVAPALLLSTGAWLMQYIGMDAMVVRSMEYSPAGEALLYTIPLLGAYTSLRLFAHCVNRSCAPYWFWRILTALPVGLALVIMEVAAFGAVSIHYFGAQSAVSVTSAYLTNDTWLASALLGGAYTAAGIFLSAVLHDKRATERARRLTELHRDALFASNPDSIAIHDEFGLILSVNQSATTLLGYEAPELVRKRLSDFLLPDDAVRAERMFSNLLHTAHSIEYDAQCRRRDGRLMVLHIKHIPIVHDGHVAGAFSVCSDITRRRRIERELTATRQHFQILENNISDLISIIDVNGIVRYASPSHENLLGLSPKQFVQSTITSSIHPDDAPTVEDALYRMCQDTAPLSINIHFRNNEGGWLPLEARWVPVQDAAGNVTGFVMVARDLTDRKKAEEILLQTEKLSVVGQLAAGLAHEVRNPLTSIKGFLQLLFEQNKEKPRYFEIVFTELQRIEDIMSEFLVMAKPHLEAFQSQDICGIVKETAALMTAEAHLRNVDLKLSTPDLLPNIWCDTGKIKQVLINLIKNAMDAMPHGGTLRLEAERLRDDRIAIRVADTGVGIPEDKLAKLGTPFFTTKQTGTGLGLTVSQKIIQDHGGELTVQSEVGVGTLATVILPSERCAEERRAATHERQI